MKDKSNQNEQSGRPPRLAPLMVEDKATEKLKKRARDLGIITNAGAGKTTQSVGKKEGGEK